MKLNELRQIIREEISDMFKPKEGELKELKVAYDERDGRFVSATWEGKKYRRNEFEKINSKLPAELPFRYTELDVQGWSDLRKEFKDKGITLFEYEAEFN
jgi:hypothetical protein